MVKGVPTSQLDLFEPRWVCLACRRNEPLVFPEDPEDDPEPPVVACGTRGHACAWVIAEMRRGD